MTKKEIEARYPIGSLIKITNDLERMKRDTTNLRWVWDEEKDEIAGKELAVLFHEFHRKVGWYLNVQHHKSCKTWFVVAEWVCSGLEIDPDLLLRKQRDEFLASVFGG